MKGLPIKILSASCGVGNHITFVVPEEIQQPRMMGPKAELLRVQSSTVEVRDFNVRPPESLLRSTVDEMLTPAVEAALAAYLAGKKAADLTVEEQTGVLHAAGVEFKDVAGGELMTRNPVGIADNPKGGYIVAIGK